MRSSSCHNHLSWDGQLIYEMGSKTYGSNCPTFFRAKRFERQHSAVERFYKISPVGIATTLMTGIADEESSPMKFTKQGFTWQHGPNSLKKTWSFLSEINAYVSILCDFP